MYRNLWQLFVKDFRGGKRMGLVCAFTVVVSLLEGFNIGLLIPLLQMLNSPEENGGHWITRGLSDGFDAVGVPFELWSILLGMGLITVLTSAAKYWRMALVAGILRDFAIWMRSKIMWNLLHTDVSYFHKQRLGRLSDTLVTQVGETPTTVLAVSEMLAGLGLIVTYMATAFLIAPVLTAVALIMVLILALVAQLIIARAGVIGSALVQSSRAFQVATLETLTGVRVIKSFLLENDRWRDFNNRAESMGRLRYRQLMNLHQLLTLQEIGLFGLVGGLVWVGVSVLHLDIAMVIALLLILYRLNPRISTLNTNRQSLAAAFPALRAVCSEIADTSNPKIISGDKPFVGLGTGIELKHVSFAYDGGSEVLRDTSFTIERGSTTAIVGASGAGKSTLIDLLLRYYDPHEGSICVDRVDLRELDLVSWRSSIGVVSQDIFLFNDTIAANIGLARPGADTGAIVAAAEQAYAHDFILQLPQGYDTEVGDRGWNLSGGQRQRIALARAILAKPEILVLDEATSSLDSESEELIQDYIRSIKGACTIVMVAHRLSTIQDSDKIVVLQEGTIVEQGNWDGLVAGGGVFANYHRLQSGG